VATKIPSPRPFWGSHCHQPPASWPVQTPKLRCMVTRYTITRLVPRIFSPFQRHNTRSQQHHRHGTLSLQGLSVSRLRLHQCRLTRRELHYRDLQFEQDKPVHCRADRQSLDTRLQTKATRAILTHFLPSESHRPHRHQRPLLWLMEQDRKIDSRLVGLLLYPKAPQSQMPISLQKAKRVHKRLRNSLTWSISRQCHNQQVDGHQDPAEMVLPRYQGFGARRQ
jgi:hypothetical protein